MRRRLVVVLLFVPIIAVSRDCPGAEPACAWRGNRTGLWPEASPVLEWSRIPHGAGEGLRCRSSRPAGADANDAAGVEKGLIREWPVVGPFAVGDAEKNFDDDMLGGASSVQPSAGDKVAGREWKPLTAPADDPMAFGTAEMPWLDVGKEVGFQINPVAGKLFLAVRLMGRVAFVGAVSRGCRDYTACGSSIRPLRKG